MPLVLKIGLFNRLANRLARPGIRALLILLLLPVLLALLILDSLNDYRTLSDTSAAAYDTSLAESAQLLGGGLLLSDQGEVRVAPALVSPFMDGVEIKLHRYVHIEEIEPRETHPPEAHPLETRPFASHPLEPRPFELDGLFLKGATLAGAPDLPRPSVWPADGLPVFYDALYHGEPVRAVAVLRTLRRAGLRQRVLVIVAESEAWRAGLASNARGQEIRRDMVTLLLEIALLWLGVSWALRSLQRLSREVDARGPDDLTPLDTRSVPSEVAPLVKAINLHLERHRQMLDERSQFLADASHQLRTPLAIISTQVQYALRERDAALAREALTAVVEQLGRGRRLVEQLLSLAHASQSEVTQHAPVDLSAIARCAVMQYLPLAHEKKQDLGWVDLRGPDADCAWVSASEVELHEALANLIHNAIHYAREGARITVSIAQITGSAAVGDRFEVAVLDNGPGIESDLRERVFERFERGEDARAAAGSGLGLSIARAYARRNQGGVVLRDGEINPSGGRGLTAVLWAPCLRGRLIGGEGVVFRKKAS